MPASVYLRTLDTPAYAFWLALMHDTQLNTLTNAVLDTSALFRRFIEATPGGWVHPRAAFDGAAGNMPSQAFSVNSEWDDPFGPGCPSLRR